MEPPVVGSITASFVLCSYIGHLSGSDERDIDGHSVSTRIIESG